MTPFEEVVAMVETLTPLDRVRLVKHISETLEHELEEQPKMPLPNLYGAWADLGIDISEDDIDEIRHEMWGNFARQEIS